MILSIAIQFIPTLSEETETIRKAQMARGARFDSPKITEKAEAVLRWSSRSFCGVQAGG